MTGGTIETFVREYGLGWFSAEKRKIRARGKGPSAVKGLSPSWGGGNSPQLFGKEVRHRSL